MNVSGWNARLISGIPMIPAIKESDSASKFPM